MIEKNITIIQNRQTAKTIQLKPKTAGKTVKSDKFLHPSYQNPNQSNASGAHRGFPGTRDQWRHIVARASIEEKPELKEDKRKPHRIPNPKIGYYSDENRNQMLKIGKSANNNEHQNRKIENPNAPVLK